MVGVEPYPESPTQSFLELISLLELQFLNIKTQGSGDGSGVKLVPLVEDLGWVPITQIRQL